MGTSTDFWKRESGGVTDEMTTDFVASATGTFPRGLPVADLLASRWHDFWHGEIGGWILTRGLLIVLLVIGGLLGARFISWVAVRISSRIDASFQQSDALVRSESAKHRQAVASVISYLAIALLGVLVLVEIVDVLAVPISSLVAPAAVLGAALGFGAQRVVQDLLSGFFIITEKQYGFGDLVQLNVGAGNDAMGTVEEVTLRVTKLRTTEGEVYTIANGQIVKSLNLSKDWARAVVDIPVPAQADLNLVNDVLHHVCEAAPLDPQLRDLLLDKPQLRGVESIEVDAVNLRMVARTLPGKQFEVGRRLRLLVVAALARAGIASPADSGQNAGATAHPSTAGGAEQSQGLSR
jgi:small conductance mechanosensitive channel